MTEDDYVELHERGKERASKPCYEIFDPQGFVQIKGKEVRVRWKNGSCETCPVVKKSPIYYQSLDGSRIGYASTELQTIRINVNGKSVMLNSLDGIFVHKDDLEIRDRR